VPHDRGAVVIDSSIIASTARNAAGHAAGVPDAHTTASARGARTAVHVVPMSGVPVDSAAVEHAVAERLGRLDDRFARHVTVRVSEKGTLS
jgi:hypothetical protein